MKDIHANSSKSLKEQKAKGKTEHFRLAIFGLMVARNVPLTDREVMSILQEQDVNNVRPEITRLKQDGLLVEVDKVKCLWTGKSVRRCRWNYGHYRARQKQKEQMG